MSSTSDGQEFRVDYLPAESDSGMFGGNSNWRGPIWFPTNALLVRALLNLYSYYGDDFTVECPTGSGVQATLFDAAMEIMRRSSAIFLRDADGRRPVFGGAEKFQTDPHWRDYLLFYEYFHGDNGRRPGREPPDRLDGARGSLHAHVGHLHQGSRPAAASHAKKLAYGLAERRGGGMSASGAEPAPRPVPSAAAGRRLDRVATLFSTRSTPGPGWTELSRELGRPATLDDVPDADLDAMGRGGLRPGLLPRCLADGRRRAGRVAQQPGSGGRSSPASCPTLTEDDICGSCFAVTGYEVAAALGGDEALGAPAAAPARARSAADPRLRPQPHGTRPPLGRRSTPSTTSAAREEDLAREPQNYCRVSAPGGPAASEAPSEGDAVLAYGRDPYFDGWPDTLQLDYGNPALREAMRAELGRVADRCDGVRCDMAMLVLPEVFERTWGIPTEPFWPDAIAKIKADHPGFLFMAEVYWDLEWELQQQGFDYTYDKRLYDRLVEGDVPDRARSPARPHGLPGALGAIPREPRRAAGGGDLRPREAPGGRGHHLPLPGAALLPPGAAGRGQDPSPGAPVPAARSSRWTKNWRSSTGRSWPACATPRCARASGASSSAGRRGTATGPTSAS